MYGKGIKPFCPYIPLIDCLGSNLGLNRNNSATYCLACRWPSARSAEEKDERVQHIASACSSLLSPGPHSVDSVLKCVKDIVIGVKVE
jgi:hypothetical protein